MKQIVLAFLTVIFWSCNKEDAPIILMAEPVFNITEPDSNTTEHKGESDGVGEGSWTTYHIKKGSNFNSGINFAALGHDTIAARIYFDQSAIHQTLIPENQWDWSKLIGFSDCSSFHQLNSIRLVWRWNPQTQLIELGEYIYRSGQVSYTKIHEVQIDEIFHVMIYVSSNTYHIRINGVDHSSPRPCGNSNNRYWLLPYFGGNEPAPQDIDIHIKHIYPSPA